MDILNASDLINVLIWTFAGIVTLTNKYGITKLEYGLCWLVLMLQLVLNCFGI